MYTYMFRKPPLTAVYTYTPFYLVTYSVCTFSAENVGGVIVNPKPQ